MHLSRINYKCVSLYLLVALLTSGCASKVATSDGMLATRYKISKSESKKTVNVHVVGVFEDSPSFITRPAIPYSEFARSVNNSLINSHLFDQATDKNSANYQLVCAFFGLEQKGSLDITSIVEIAWILKRTSDAKVVWRDIIKTEKTLTVSDEFVGMTRMRLAAEVAAQMNIEQALSKISKLAL